MAVHIVEGVSRQIEDRSAGERIAAVAAILVSGLQRGRRESHGGEGCVHTHSALHVSARRVVIKPERSAAADAGRIVRLTEGEHDNGVRRHARRIGGRNLRDGAVRSVRCRRRAGRKRTQERHNGVSAQVGEARGVHRIGLAGIQIGIGRKRHGDAVGAQARVARNARDLKRTAGHRTRVDRLTQQNLHLRIHRHTGLPVGRRHLRHHGSRHIDRRSGCKRIIARAHTVLGLIVNCTGSPVITGPRVQRTRQRQSIRLTIGRSRNRRSRNDVAIERAEHIVLAGRQQGQRIHRLREHQAERRRQTRCRVVNRSPRNQRCRRSVRGGSCREADAARIHQRIAR